MGRITEYFFVLEDGGRDPVCDRVTTIAIAVGARLRVSSAVKARRLFVVVVRRVFLFVCGMEMWSVYRAFVTWYVCATYFLKLARDHPVRTNRLRFYTTGIQHNNTGRPPAPLAVARIGHHLKAQHPLCILVNTIVLTHDKPRHPTAQKKL